MSKISFNKHLALPYMDKPLGLSTTYWVDWTTYYLFVCNNYYYKINKI